MSSTDDILSPYLASKPPVEKPTDSTMSGLMTERPSCCPLRTRKGRYISMPFMYTLFSSKLPPRTLYCEDSSLWVDTPACACIISSTALPVTLGACLMSLVSRCWVLPVCRRSPVTVTPASSVSLNSCINRVCLPRGRLSTRVLVLYPIIENLTTTLSVDCKRMEYSPFRFVMVILPCCTTATVASSIGFICSSVTFPCSVKVWAFAFMKSKSKGMIMLKRILSIGIYNVGNRCLLWWHAKVKRVKNKSTDAVVSAFLLICFFRMGLIPDTSMIKGC